MPYTIYFSDRPARDAGFAPMDKFLKGFCFSASNPPNALVWLRDGEEENDMIVVELTRPQYDETNSTLTYTAKLLDDYAFKSEWIKDLLSKADKAIPETFGQVAIVIDDCSNSEVQCSKVNSPDICGYINTGCCWRWKDIGCEPCHSADTYNTECKQKFGSTCAYFGWNDCFG